MSMKKLLLSAISLSLVIAVSPWSPSEASGIVEADTHIWCSEAGQESLPRRLTMIQVIDDSFFASAPYVYFEVFASYLFRFDVDSGKVVVTGVLLKADGTEHDLPRLAGRMQFGDADKTKSTDLVIERGDIIEWNVKLKGLAPLAGPMDCLMIQVGVVASEMGTLKSEPMSVSAALRSIKR